MHVDRDPGAVFPYPSEGETNPEAMLAKRTKPWKTVFSSSEVIVMEHGRFTKLNAARLGTIMQNKISALFSKEFPCAATFDTVQKKEKLQTTIARLFNETVCYFYSNTEGLRPVYLPLFGQELIACGLLPKSMLPLGPSLNAAQIKTVIDHYLAKYQAPTVDLRGELTPIHLEWLTFENLNELATKLTEKKSILLDRNKPVRIIFTGFCKDAHGFTIAIDRSGDLLSIYKLDSMEYEVVTAHIRDHCAFLFESFDMLTFESPIQTDGISCAAYALKLGKMAAFEQGFLDELSRSSKPSPGSSSSQIRSLTISPHLPSLFPFLQSPLERMDPATCTDPRIAKIHNPAEGYIRRVLINHDEKALNIYMRTQLAKYFYMSLIQPINMVVKEDRPLFVNASTSHLVQELSDDDHDADEHTLQFELDL